MTSVKRWALYPNGTLYMINLLHVCGRIPSPADCKSGPGGQAGKEAFCWCYEPETNKPPPPPLKQATKWICIIHKNINMVKNGFEKWTEVRSVFVCSFPHLMRAKKGTYVVVTAAEWWRLLRMSQNHHSVQAVK